MINQESQFKLQAYLDGELPAAETAAVKEWIARDAEARALFQELQDTKSVLCGNEAGCKLPETREFFWSKIEREINRQNAAAPAPVRKMSWFVWVQNHFLPVSGVALLSCMLAFLSVFSGRAGSQFGELEVASDDMGAYTFRDQQQQITMVWLYDRTDRDDDLQFTDPASLANLEPE